jgi:DNA-binding transcriptional ArsR family regulator
MMQVEHGVFDVLVQLNPNEIRILKHLVENVHYGNICYDRQVDIVETTGIGPSHMSQYISRLRQLNVIRKYRRSLFMINPEYFFAGSLDEKPKLRAVYSKLDKVEVDDAEDN